MGRYYNGDISGKFWFGVQASDDADFFGVKGQEPNYLEYDFDKSDIGSIERGIKTCEKKLGKNKKKLDKFFNDFDSYNDEMIVKECGIGPEKVKELLEWYARLSLGKEILACVKKNGSCSFSAEL